jgi:hypothetical protein
MLIDRVEVSEVEIKKSMNIQREINSLKFMEPSAKSDIDPKKALSAFQDYTDFNIFFDDQGFGDSDKIADRIGRYDTYSEMDSMEFIHRGLELISDDSSQSNDEGDVLRIFSDNESIKETLSDLFIKKLDLNNELWSIFYETIKFGDNFYEIIVDDYSNPKEIKRIRYLDPRKIEIIEVNGKLSHFL